MEEFAVDSLRVVAVHLLLNFLGPCLLAILIDILSMADRTGSG